MNAFRILSFALMLGLGACSQYGYPGNSASNGGSWGGQPAGYGGVGIGGGYGYGGSTYGGQSVLFRPARGITCERAREICYDRYGLDYFATQRYFSEHDANQSVRKYGEQVFLFAPKRGVTCDRRTRTCSDAGGLDTDWTDDIFGDKAERKVNTWLAGDSFVPERYVTCVNATKVCSDKNGPSITLTQIYYGRAAAD
ncbi:MAG TPA: hypothetical protein PLR41_19455, partial [Alphaproteobacteria bacterium]|nr:hypothetical protein [Alphaproteobacteria bacterium]